jgi:hypothetical protein
MPSPKIKVIFEVMADNLADVADTMGEFLKTAHTQGVHVETRVPADTAPRRDPPAEDDPLLGGGAPPPDDNAGTQAGADIPAPEAGRRVRDRTAERRAKKEREEAENREREAAQAAKVKANKPNGAADATPPDDDPLMGSDTASHTDPFDTPIPPADAPPGRTPQQLMDASIIILRQCYGVPGGMDAVKIVQKEFKVAQFTQVELAKASVLYNRALGVANDLGVKLPPGV